MQRRSAPSPLIRLCPRCRSVVTHPVVQHRRRLLHDPPTVAAGAVETPVEQRFEQGLLAEPDRLRQIAVLQRAQKPDGLGDPGPSAPSGSRPARPVTGSVTRPRTSPAKPVSSRRAKISLPCRPSGLSSPSSLRGHESASGAADGSLCLPCSSPFSGASGPTGRSCRRSHRRGRASGSGTGGHCLGSLTPPSASCSPNVRPLRRQASQRRSWCRRP